MSNSSAPVKQKQGFSFRRFAALWRTASVCLVLFFFPIAWLAGFSLRAPAPALPYFAPSSDSDLPTDNGGPAESAAESTPAERITFSPEEISELDAFCEAQPGTLSVYVQALDTGEIYSYNTDMYYYSASLLKAPYALWLCEQADDGLLDLDGTIPYPKNFQSKVGPLAFFYRHTSIPARTAMAAMLMSSDNDATSTLGAAWPGEEAFQAFLTELHFAYPETCSVTAQTIMGMVTAQDMANAFLSIYRYLNTDAAHSAPLKQYMSHADHTILYLPDDVIYVKKYGSWDYAYHDAAIVYATHPYLVVAMSDWGNADADFPPEATARMQALGQLVAAYTQN